MPSQTPEERAMDRGASSATKTQDFTDGIYEDAATDMSRGPASSTSASTSTSSTGTSAGAGGEAGDAFRAEQPLEVKGTDKATGEGSIVEKAENLLGGQ